MKNDKWIIYVSLRNNWFLFFQIFKITYIFLNQQNNFGSDPKYVGIFYDCHKLKGHISIDPNNTTFRTDGTNIYRKDNGKEVDVWW